MKAYVSTREVGVILQDVVEERKRQDRLRDAGKFKYTCADPEIPLAAAIAALGEEFGEVCTEALKLGGDVAVDPGEDVSAHLRAELVQVAAVCVAWVEKIDREHRARVAAQRGSDEPDNPMAPKGWDPHGNRI